MNQLYRHEKLQLFTLGLVAPAVIVVATSLYLFSGKTVFPSKGHIMVFYGMEAYLVSLLWYGAAVSLFGCKFLAFICNPFKKELIVSASLWLGTSLIALGLLAGIWFTVSS